MVILATIGLRKSTASHYKTYGFKLSKALHDSVEIRLNQYELDNEFILSSILDPGFKLRWCEYDAQEKNLPVKNQTWKALHHQRRVGKQPISSAFYLTRLPVESDILVHIGCHNQVDKYL